MYRELFNLNTSAKVLAFVGERLAARGLSVAGETELRTDGVEARVDPLSFNLHALEDNADATKGLPLETHRDGIAGRAVVLAKRLFRTAGQIFINEALGRQTAFNGHVRDSYAQLSAEVLRLRQRVAELEQQKTVVAAPVVAAPVVAKPVLPPAPPSQSRRAQSRPYREERQWAHATHFAPEGEAFGELLDAIARVTRLMPKGRNRS